jgi:hypothetical protein
MHPPEDAAFLVGCPGSSFGICGSLRSIGYLAPRDKLEGREAVIFAERDRKLQQARAERKRKRQAERQDVAIAYKQEIPGAQPVSRAAMLPSAAREPLTRASTGI